MGFNPWTIVAEFAIGIGLSELKQWLSDPIARIRDHRVDSPSSQEGSPVPIIYGQVRVRQPLLAWYGGARAFSADEISWVEIGNHDLPPTLYGLNMLFVLGVPMGPISSTSNAVLYGMWVGDTKVKLNIVDGSNMLTDFPGNIAPGPFSVPNLFQQIGRISFYGGTSTQRLSDNVGPKNNNPLSPQYWDFDLTFAGRFMSFASLTAPNLPDVTTIPGYRNQMCVALTGDLGYPLDPTDVSGNFLSAYVIGPDPTLPSISFEVMTRSFPYAVPALSSGDADPAAVIKDILTNPWAKMNIDPARIDDTSFMAASVTLLAELHGYSRVIDARTDAKALLQEIVSQTGGVLFQDPYDGLIKFVLMRGGYTPSSLPLFDESSIIRFDDYDPGTWRNLNQVWVKYNDRTLGYNDATALAQNEASAVIQDVASEAGQPAGRVRSVVVEYPGCCTPQLAKQLAQRDLNLLSQPLAKATIIVNRTAHAVRPGDLIRVTFGSYYMTQVVFRILNVDLGLRDKGEIKLDVIQDLYVSDAVSTGPGGYTLFIPTPEPLTRRVVTEAPYWMMAQAVTAGFIPSADTQRILAVATPDDAADSFLERTASGGANYQGDVVMARFPVSAKVHTAYGRELGPYDTTTGLVLDTLSANTSLANILASSASAATLRATGANLIMVGTEIMQYESVTDLTGGVFRLNNVSREALDTASHDHAVGEDVYWIGTQWAGLRFVGLQGWANVAGVRAQAVPKLGILGIGSGEEATDTISFALRGLLPSRGADFVLCAEVATGTQGIPAGAAPAGQVGTFKKLTSLEEGFGYAWKKRDRKTTTVSRGDDADETPTDVDPTTWDVYAQKLRSGFTPSPAAADAEISMRTALTAANTSDGVQIGGVGYGDIDVLLHTRRTKPAGGGGILASVIYSEWDAPRVRVRAERWRNLVANARFDYHGAGTNLLPGWTQSVGLSQINASAIAVTLKATDCYVITTSGLSSTITELFDVSGYLARGMTARLEFYARNSPAETQTLTSKIEALDAGSSVLATTTVTAAVTPSNTEWTRYAGTVVCPAGTVLLRVTLQLGLRASNAGVIASEVCVRLGHTPLYDLMFDSSFGGTVFWTVDAGGFTVASAIKSPSPNYHQGGAFSACTEHQDYNLVGISPGYELGGTAILNIWRAQTLANDTGKVTLQCLDVSNAVLASASTGSEVLPALNQWFKRRLSVEIPEGTAKLRVQLDAGRALGSGIASACFDECIVEVHKDLSDPRYYRALNFDVPTVQPVPATWQEFHLSYPALWAAGIADPSVFAGGNTPAGVTMQFSDGASHPTQLGVKMFGNFGASPFVTAGGASTSAIRFDRASGVGALDYQATNESQGKFANWNAATPFTVVALIRVDEDAFSVACGITGRTGATAGSPGWGLEINASGEAVGTLWGSLGTKSANNAGAKVTDGALHLVGMSYDPIAHTLTVVDETHTTSVSTASGMGEIQNGVDAIPFRIGRSRDSIDTMPGVICRLYFFGSALTSSQMQSLFTYSKDPTGVLTTYTRSKEAWTPGLFEANGSATLVKLAANQVALGFDLDLEDDGGTGWGLALCKANTNLIPSFDFAGASWVKDGTTTLTQGVIDATGKPRGVTVVSPNTSNGLKVIGLSVGAPATLQVCFYARTPTGTPTLNVELQNATNVVKQTIGVVMNGGAVWTLYTASFTLWDNSTPTCRLRFISASGSTTFDLTHVMWAAQGTEIAALWPDAGQSLADVTAMLTETQLKQLNLEGEMILTGVGTVVSPPQSTIATVDNAVNGKNWREILAGASQQPRFDHYDGAASPANVASQGTAINWRDSPWKIRGRWCVIGTLDNAATPFAGVVTVASVNSAVYGRSAAWTYDTTPNTRIRLGSGSSAAMNCYLRSAIVRAREEKLV